MGTIVEKSEYLTETKDKIKESINNLGGDITSETTFREYAQELDNIYDNLPKTTGEDTNLSLTTLKGKMNIIPKGDTEQTQYSGYNLYNANVASKTENGLTITNMGNGIYKVNGTATADLSTALNDEFMQVSGTFRVSGCPSGGSSSTYMLSAYVGYWGGGSPNIDTGSGTNITYTGNFKLRLYIKSGTTCNNLIFKPMVTTDLTKNYADYEPYVGGTASPNPTYPQNIEVVTGTQDVKVENKNLLEGIELGDINSQTGAESTSTSVLRGTNYIRYFTNTDYFPSVNGNLIASGSVINLRFYNKDKQYIGYATLLRTGGRNFNITITTSVVDTTPYYFRIRTTTSVAKTTDNVMISYSSDTTYVEHQEQTQIVSLGDIELCKIGNYQDYLYKTSGKNLNDMSYWNTNTGSGMTLTNNKDGSINVNGTATGLMVYKLSNAIQLKANTTYYITGGYSENCKIDLRDNNLQTYGSSSTGVNSVGTYTPTTDTTAYLCIRVPSGITISNVKMLPMISTENNIPFEPYGSGKWYKKEQIGKINLDNTRTFQYDANNSVFYYAVANRKADTETTQNIYCTKLFWNGNFAGVGATSSMVNYQIACNNNGSSKNIFVKNTNYNTSDAFNTWLSGLNTYIYYVLGTENDIQITNETLIEQLDNLEKLMSYNGTTNISSSGNLPMILSVSALKGE